MGYVPSEARLSGIEPVPGWRWGLAVVAAASICCVDLLLRDFVDDHQALLDRPVKKAPVIMGEYRVLSGDFHVHMFPLDASTLSPWDVVVEARRRGLDVIALTGHNQAWTAKIGRAFSRLTGGPMVLVGEEVITPPFDMIAVGIPGTIHWRRTAAETAAEIHRQGGVAIAAHPLRGYWPAYESAIPTIDGAEVMHPMAFAGDEFAAELREFYGRREMTAIGSSDFHGLSFPGFSRTHVFVREVTQEAVLDALRNRRTVTVHRDGSAYGNADLIRLAEANGGLTRSGVVDKASAWSALSRFAALAGMLAAVLFGFTSRP